ncbi:hypothetical protein RRG08_045993 [Elysia crispata]|uniref:Reverse transcriptase/retrotransposon-derived protein RNase H-like domain-containing protein n=1 Tax=Elysia crispata TaxID=231223 RepID=A0AAE0Z1W6_9GAST|nr:hypothetical protein RRG08_045993 [Elysia crispata]
MDSGEYLLSAKLGRKDLGLSVWSTRFLPGIAKLLAPLTEATKSRGKVITWTDECQTAFEAAKSSLASATLLNHPDPKSDETRLSTDASDSAFGAELSQKHHGMWRPIAFFSRKLTSKQSRYSTFDRELLAIYSAIQHFRFFLEGRPFSVLTDHKPLTYALTSKTARSPRQERQLTYIAEFTTDIRYISGTDNVVPDVLSRASCAEQPMVASESPIPPIDLARMAEEQLRDPKVAELRKQPGALKLKEVNLDGCILLCDVSTSRPRPIVPPLWTKTIFEAIHNLSHPGHKPTTRAISARYVWPGLKREVKNMSNGMVERFHRSLKAALKARLLGPGWMDELPIVLLGIRSTWKEDLDAAPALLTYGTNLRIPGDFFPSNSAERISPGSTFVRDLQENFRKLSPLSPVHHGTTKKYLPRDLMSAEQVYVRHDAHRGPLVRPYDGPFKVLYCSDKHFDILRNNKSTRVSIDSNLPILLTLSFLPRPCILTTRPHE